jgi:dsDNA-specific endonuclease/ATPase MutS2
MNSNAKNALETAEELKKNLDKLLKIQRQSINSLPEAERAKLQFVNSEINQIMKAAKEGDFNKLQEISKKYASSTDNN